MSAPFGLSPFLYFQRIVLCDHTLYALYPLPQTFCSKHNLLHLQSRDIASIKTHISGLNHCGRLILYEGADIPDTPVIFYHLSIVEICSMCGKISGSQDMAHHMENVHNADPFNELLRTDISDIIGYRRDPMFWSPFGFCALSHDRKLTPDASSPQCWFCGRGEKTSQNELRNDSDAVGGNLGQSHDNLSIPDIGSSFCGDQQRNSADIQPYVQIAQQSVPVVHATESEGSGVDDRPYGSQEGVPFGDKADGRDGGEETFLPVSAEGAISVPTDDIREGWQESTKL